MEIDSYLSERHKNRKRRRAYLGIFLVSLAVCLVFVGAGWLVIRSPLFHLKKIAIEGNKTISSGAIMDLLQSRVVGGSFLNAFMGFGNILIWPGEIARNDLTVIPEIENITIKKDYRAAAVFVGVMEREPYGIWCTTQTDTDVTRTNTNIVPTSTDLKQISVGAEIESPSGSVSSQYKSVSCWWFDKDGTLFKRALAAEGSLITAVDDYSQKNLGLGSAILPHDFIANIFSVFNVLKSSGLGIEEIRLNDIAREELEILTYDGPKLYFSLRFPADNDSAVIKELTAKSGFKNLEYIDFRVENRAYYR